jgi:hypothetical protein
VDRWLLFLKWCEQCVSLPAQLCVFPLGFLEMQCGYHQFSASAVELEFLRSERRLRSGRHFA